MCKKSEPEGEINISKQAKDIIQKYISGLFRDATLEFYGVKTAKVKEPLNAELPVVEVADTSSDFVFSLEDGSILHIEFQTGYKKADLIRFAMYNLRLYEKYKGKIRTVIIYAADVKKKAINLNIGSLVFSPDVVFMSAYDGDNIYAGLETKLKRGQALEDADMLKLALLPLMSNSLQKVKLAERTIEISREIEDRRKRDICIGAAFAFSLQYLNEIEIKQILEVLKMANVDTIWNKILIDERLEGKAARDAEHISRLLKRGKSIDEIADVLAIPVEDIKTAKTELGV